MLKYLVVILMLVSCSVSFGQQQLSSKEMIGLTPVVPQAMNLSPEVKKVLGQKLLQMVTQNGFGSFSGQFVLTANVVVVDKQVTSTVPAQFVVSLEVSCYLLNVAEMVIVDETSFAVKGIDKLENKAMIQAVNQIAPKSPNVRNFMAQCRTKIVDYYATRIPALLAKAKSLSERDEYEEALAVLSAIPESVDEYPAIAEQMVVLYTKVLDKNAATAIQSAKGKIALRDYEGAIGDLIYVDPSSTHFASATKMINSIKQTIDAEEQAALEQQMKMYEAEMDARQKAHDDAVSLEKQRIDAAKQIGTAQAQQSSTASGKGEDLDTRVGKWFLGKFK